MIATGDGEQANAPPLAPGLHVQLTGDPGAWVGGRWVEFRPDRRYLLLARLALADGWVGRDRLADLFWPETTTDRALCNLRQLLKRASSLGWTGGVERRRDSVRFCAATDVKEMEAAAARGDHEAALRWVRGPLLAGFEGDPSAEVASWLARERQRLAERLRALKLDLAARLAEAGRHETAAQLLRGLMRVDAYDEEATFAYMQVVVASGRPLEALRAYQWFSRRLLADLGLRPCRCTRQLAEEIGREGDVPPPVPPAAWRSAFAA